MSEKWYSTKDAVPASGPHLITGVGTNSATNENERWYGIAYFEGGEWYDEYDPNIRFRKPTHFQSLTVPDNE